MAMFVHLAPEKYVKSILRNGISRLREKAGYPHGIFAMPVTRNFYISHQWLRELKQRGQGPIAAVYFRVPDSLIVWVGHYNQPHQQMTAAAALALISVQQNAEGFEVIVPERIGRDQVHRVKSLPQVLGWRYYPGAKGQQPFCHCRYCNRGEIRAQRLIRED